MKYLTLSTLFMATTTLAQVPGGLDLSYNANDPGYGIGDGANTAPPDIRPLADGRTLVLTMNYQGQSTGGMAWIQPDGVLDAVMPATLVGIQRVLEQADGKLLIAGTFTQVEGVARNRVARLNADGSLDLSFDPGAGPDNSVIAMALQPDGKVLLGGFFTMVDGIASGRIARLLTDGTVDPSFDPGIGANGAVRTFSILSDGRIFMAGNFTGYNGTETQRLAILDGDGGLLNAYPGNDGVSLVVNTSVVDDQDRVWFGGEFGGAFSGRVRRLLADGTPDAAFSSTTMLQPLDMALLPGYQVLLGGKYFSQGGGPRVLRLNEDGTEDDTFQVDPGPSGSTSDVHSVARLPDGRYLVGGSFRYFNDRPRSRLVCLLPDGTIDLDHMWPVGGANREVNKVLVLPDGRHLVGGLFRGFNEAVVPGLVMTWPDGTVDGTFAPAMINALDHVYEAALQPDQKILVVYGFAPELRRLLPNGDQDPTFSIGTGPDNSVTSLRLRSNGKLLVAGYFETFNGVPRNRVAQLEVDGALDPSFDPPGAMLGPGYVDIAIEQPDGKVLVGGSFIQLGGGNNTCVTRLMPNGTLDPTFNGGGAGTFTEGGGVSAIELLPDGRILIAGGFGLYNGVQRRGVARLLANGELDMTFVPPLWNEYGFNDLKVLPDGKVILVGAGNGVGLIHRLNIDGSLDTTFDTGGVASSAVSTVAVQDDGGILVGGVFTSIAGTGRNRIARLFGGTSVDVPDRAIDQVVRLHPNPTNGLLTIHMDAPTFNNGHLRVLATDGRVLLQQRMNGPREVLDVQRLAAGSYTIELLKPGGGRIVERFIKE